MINIYKFIGILGLLAIILGTLMFSIGKNIPMKKIYSYFLIGGIGLTIYSIYIKDLIFIILEISYILVIIYNFIKLKSKN